MVASGDTFHTLGIAPGLLKVVDGLKFTTPTPIQSRAIPPAVEGRDIIGIAQTGTGKTLAFGIPLVQHLAQGDGCALILLPTRELAIQVNETVAKLAAPFGIGTAVLIGGESMQTQIRALRAGPRVIIATPGRLNDHIDQGRVVLDHVSVLVLDEADRMLDMGFYPQIERILQLTPRARQTMLFSASMPAEIVKLAGSHMRLPVSTEVAPSGTAAERVSQELFVVRRENKLDLVGELLKQYTGQVLLFVRTKHGASRVVKQLAAKGHAAAEIHADRTLRQRERALRGFKAGTYRILVATDIAARGIDVSGIELVVNYDLPDDPDNYIHRIGRTGRAGRKGHAISLATPDQGDDVRRIERIMRAAIPISEHPELPVEHFARNPVPPPPRRQFGARPAMPSRRRPTPAPKHVGHGNRHPGTRQFGAPHRVRG